QMKDAFLGIASHELRTPLTILKLGMQFMQREYADSPIGMRLADLSRSVTRMQVLIDDMLCVSAIKTGRLSLRRDTHDLVAICQAAAQELGLVTRLPVALDLPDEAVEAMVDEGRILQVINNLLSNARKYSPSNRPVVLSLRRCGDEAHLSVRDQGP